MSEQIGAYLIRIGEIDSTQVEIICAKQLSGDKRKFGEIGRELGIINKEALLHYLEAKNAEKTRQKQNSVRKIGDFLVRISAMKPYQMDDVLRSQKAGDSRLFGEIAIEFGYINDAALRKYIEAEEEWKKIIDEV